jgi:hypothetical protein
MLQNKSKKTWLAWDGPYKVTDVKALTIEKEKREKPTMLNNHGSCPET